MTILAIETATRCIGCALWGGDGPVASFELVAGQRHSEVLMPAVDELCERAGVSKSEIGGVVADVGPGLFTGLRVGLATAVAIATGRGIPAAGVTSLEALAHRVRHRRGLVASVVDARRGEVFWSLYRSDGESLLELRGPSVALPEEAAAEVARAALSPGAARSVSAASGAGGGSSGRAAEGDPPVLVVGDGGWRYRDVFEAAGCEHAGPLGVWPSCLAVAELGLGRLAAGTGLLGAPAVALAPVYLRQADVRVGWEEVGGRVGPGAAPGGDAG
ncbi:MAG TPA: tRNA (adenosine(37)-N6)-threonylcarbamoyltransferase complex dimerization subunit type 1 TsaB [Acidimicrobiales bacterium]|nr:tRNA (adenosine(37)-N6)-threonylcarbamoyltransferase complex dimerization subunit type 1 TsaB [Acidimicrobiales bacterium]